jgi:hypothetical protein
MAGKVQFVQSMFSRAFANRIQQSPNRRMRHRLRESPLPRPIRTQRAHDEANRKRRERDP